MLFGACLEVPSSVSWTQTVLCPSQPLTSVMHAYRSVHIYVNLAQSAEICTIRSTTAGRMVCAPRGFRVHNPCACTGLCTSTVLRIWVQFVIIMDYALRTCTLQTTARRNKTTKRFSTARSTFELLRSLHVLSCISLLHKL